MSLINQPTPDVPAHWNGELYLDRIPDPQILDTILQEIAAGGKYITLPRVWTFRFLLDATSTGSTTNPC